MNLANYISDLLYRYECVIVPRFGGFVTNYKSAKIDENTIYPPFKQITFNSHLTNNDGLLANYIASVDKISYECALNYIKFETAAWREKLKNQQLLLTNLGTFDLIDNQLHFEPQKSINYLTSSFGLSPVMKAALERGKVKPIPVVVNQPKAIVEEKKKPSDFLKYAAIFIIGLSAIGFGAKYYQNYRSEQFVTEAQKRQNAVEQKIENATFVITKPLPSLNLEIETQKKQFHVIAGAFRIPENAERKVNQLLRDGYDARILGVNKWNLSIVSYGSYSTERDAVNSLNRIRKNVAEDSWLLVQKF